MGWSLSAFELATKMYARPGQYNAYSGGPKGHRYMPYTLKKGPISVLEESGRNFQGPNFF